MFTYNVTISKVVDGDTFDGMVDLGFEIFRLVRFRLYGINCPESRGATKVAGLVARAKTAELILARTVVIQCLKYDKYGRSVAKVTLADGSDLTQCLLALGQGVPFMAG